MSTKKTTTTTNNYDASSMNLFHNLGAAAGKVMTDYMEDPFASSAFKARVQQGNTQALALGNRMKQNLLLGYSGSNPDAYKASQLARIGRATASMQSQNLLSNLIAQEGLRTQAAHAGLAYNPLQTGQTSETKTSGLGTWLPQVAGMALGAFTGGLGTIAAGGLGGFGNLTSQPFNPSTGLGFGVGGPVQLPTFFQNTSVPRLG